MLLMLIHEKSSGQQIGVKFVKQATQFLVVRLLGKGIITPRTIKEIVGGLKEAEGVVSFMQIDFFILHAVGCYGCVHSEYIQFWIIAKRRIGHQALGGIERIKRAAGFE